MSRIVIALGGNALQIDGAATAEEQKKVASLTAKRLISLVEAGHDLIIGHGNGPQVGAILLHEENCATAAAPSMPLETDGAMSQGQIGYWLQQAIGDELRARNIDKDVATVVTQTVVNRDDPAFLDPSKPIGPFYDEATAQKLATERGWTVKEDAGRGWRRVVPSPRPVNIVEKRVVRGLADSGVLVIATGGGGVPVFDDNGDLEGVDAVIDKDFAAALLGRIVDASILLILTAVDAVAIGYNTDHETPLNEVSLSELQQHIDAGEFAPGSMLPKVQAAMEFVQFRPENVAIITSIEQAQAALEGNAGTTIRT
ncbi:carbamate kinase [Candidatus Saccharibacteria bacterium]|nr:carbamate kinase [Candidatus Saccharibacteria bacterium]